jgi:DNA-binding NarL/FixJ family response regulator
MITVAIIEDDKSMRDLLIEKVASLPDCRLIFSSGNCHDSMNFFKDQTVDVLLVDLGLPDGRGEDVIRYATRLHPELNAMVISVFGDERHVFEAIQAGATGYLLKDDLPEDFAGAIELLNSGGAPINPMIARQIITRELPKHTLRLPKIVAICINNRIIYTYAAYHVKNLLIAIHIAHFQATHARTHAA